MDYSLRIEIYVDLYLHALENPKEKKYKQLKFKLIIEIHFLLTLSKEFFNTFNFGR
jgi:hypothetical protein